MNEHKTDLAPWTCGKCNGTNMIIVGVGKEIKVFCSNKDCLEPFPQLKVTVTSMAKKTTTRGGKSSGRESDETITPVAA